VAVFGTCQWSFATLDDKQPDRSKLAEFRRDRTTAITMDPAMSSVRKERMCLRA